MVSARPGRTSLGCLFLLLVFTAAAYFGVNVGEVYWRAYQFKDAMRQEARFAATIADRDIERHLITYADSLGLPDEARDNLDINRSLRDRTISIDSEYEERVELPMYVRVLRFKPHVEASY